MGKVNIKQLNVAPASGYVIGSGAGGVPVWKLESSSVDWSNITGNQAVINLSGFTNDAGFITGNQTITLSGDVTGSGTTAITTTIANNAVSNAKFRQSAANSIIGNPTGVTANIQDITSTSGTLLRNNGTLGWGAASLNMIITTSQRIPFGSVSNTLEESGSLLYNNGTGVLTAGSIVSPTTGFRINGSATSGNYLRGNGTNFVSSTIQVADIPTGIDHGGLSGLADDDHSQYALLAGRSTGQTLIGGSASLTLVGGTGTSADLNFKTTTGVGTTGSDMHFLVGNNGATEAMTILSNGRIGIGTAAPSSKFNIQESSATDLIIKMDASNASGGGTYFDLLSKVGNSRYRMFAYEAGGTYIQSGNYAFTGNAPITFSGYFGNQGSNLNFNFSTTYFSGGVSIGSAGPVASAKLEIVSTTQGFLPPRMTATQGSAIASPAEGLMIYVTDTNGTFTTKGWWGYNGAAWQQL